MSDIIPAGNGDDPVTALLLRAATDPNFDAAKFEVAVAFLRERETAASRRAFNNAMAAAQSEMRAVPRDRSNDHLRSRYATLNGMLGVLLPIASKHGIGVRFGSAPASMPGLQCITCTLSLGDHVETTPLEGPIGAGGSAGGRTQMTPIQAVGSTTTYLRRYLLAMCFGLQIADDGDDDGEAGRGPRRGSYGTGSPPSRPPGVSETSQGRTDSGAPRMTAAQWLDKIDIEFAHADRAGVDALLADAYLQKMQEWLTNGARDRLEHIINQAIARTADSHGAPAGEATDEGEDAENDGVFAPGQDPFATP